MKTSPDEVNAATFYAVGRVIELNDSVDTGGSITIEIVKQHVAHGRNSQVVLAKLVSGVLRGDQDDNLIIGNGSMVFAKFYDPKYGPVAQGWAHEHAHFCQDSKNAEKYAYEKLTDLQGSDIPAFYGEYHFPLAATIDQVPALLFQFIPNPSLSTTSVSSRHELATLKSRAFEILQRIHASGVYHGDIAPRNLLWNSETEKLTFVDFEHAAFNDRDARLEEADAAEKMALFVECRERDDTEMLWDTLCSIGVTDERPPAKRSLLAPPAW